MKPLPLQGEGKEWPYVTGGKDGGRQKWTSVVQVARSPLDPVWLTATAPPVAHTFTAQHGAVPHHAALLQDAGDGLGALGSQEAFVAEEGDGAAQLEAVPKPFAIDWNTWIRALVVSEGCVDGRGSRTRSDRAGVCGQRPIANQRHHGGQTRPPPLPQELTSWKES